jgi:hypothetical protein
MKTVLAPNAPWPYLKPAAPAPAPEKKKRVPKPPQNQSKRRQTDAKFEEWMAKL